MCSRIDAPSRPLLVAALLFIFMAFSSGKTEDKVPAMEHSNKNDLAYLSTRTAQMLAGPTLLEDDETDEKRLFPVAGVIYEKRAKVPFSGGIYGKRGRLPFSGGIYGKRSFVLEEPNWFNRQERSMPFNGGMYG